VLSDGQLTGSLPGHSIRSHSRDAA